MSPDPDQAALDPQPSASLDPTIAAALEHGLAPQEALSTWVGNVQGQIDTLTHSVNERVVATRKIRQRYTSELNRLTAAENAAQWLRTKVQQPLPAARVETLLAALNHATHEERSAAMKLAELQGDGPLDRPSGGPILSGVMLIAIGVLITRRGAPIILLLALMILGVALTYVSVMHARQRRETAAKTIRRLSVRVNEWTDQLKTDRTALEERQSQEISAVTAGSDISARVGTMNLSTKALNVLLQQEPRGRIGQADIVGTGEVATGVGRSPRAIEAVTACQRLQRLPFPVELKPHTASTLVLLDEQETAFRLLAQLAPFALNVPTDPVYLIDFNSQGWAANVEQATGNVRVSVSQPADIEETLFEMSVQMRKNKRTEIQKPGLLVIFGVPTSLAAEARTAMFDLMLDGPSTGLSVLAAVTTQMIARSRRWSDLELSAMMLYPTAILTDQTAALKRAGWWANVAGRPVPVTLAANSVGSSDMSVPPPDAQQAMTSGTTAARDG